MANQNAGDIAEIRNLIARIAVATDVGDLGDLQSIYAENAVLTMRAVPGVPPDEGRATILAGSAKRREDGITGPGSGMVHALQQSAIAVDGDAATATTYVILFRNATKAPEMSGVLMYNDSFTFTADGWRLSQRFIDPIPAG